MKQLKEERAITIIKLTSLSCVAFTTVFNSLILLSPDKLYIKISQIIISGIITLLLIYFGQDILIRRLAIFIARRSPQTIIPNQSNILGRYELELRYTFVNEDGESVERTRRGYVEIDISLLGLKVECRDMRDARTRDIVINYWNADFVSVFDQQQERKLTFIYNIFRNNRSLAGEGKGDIDKIGLVEVSGRIDGCEFDGTFGDIAVLRPGEVSREGYIYLRKIPFT